MLVVKTNSLGQPQWARTIGGDGDEEAESVIALSDGSYVVCIYTKSFPLSKRSILLVKIDANGNTLLTRAVTGEDNNRAEDMIATSDGGFLVVGDLETSWTDAYDIEAIKFDSAFTIEWVGVYSGNDDENSDLVAESRDGGYFLTG